MASLSNSTICALATPHAMGALAVVRLSGAQALEVAQRVFRSSMCAHLPSQAQGYRAYVGRLVQSNGEPLDQVVLTVFRAPHSFTGEDVVEIAFHGSLYLQQAVLQLLVEQGAVLAGPGEFSQRAFLNGKMDLTQAEAVADVIAAQSRGAHTLALSQLRGAFSKELAALREQLVTLASLMELELDFSEEDVEFANRDQLKALVDTLIARIALLCESFSTGNAIKNGIPVAIVGAVNAGKSTLLNALLGHERAIVSSIAGTTRDTIEDTLMIDGVLFRFIDTAGLRESEDVVEQMGVARTREQLRNAKVVLQVLDATRPETHRESLQAAAESAADHIIGVVNKIDAVEGVCDTWTQVWSLLSKKPLQVVQLSAKNGQGIEALKALLKETLALGPGASGVSGAGVTGAGAIDAAGAAAAVVLTNVRHYQELTAALEALRIVKNGLGEEALPTVLLTPALRQALYHMGALTGQITPNEVLGSIFSKFCIGK